MLPHTAPKQTSTSPPPAGPTISKRQVQHVETCLEVSDGMQGAQELASLQVTQLMVL
jgi:hypothetical protein